MVGYKRKRPGGRRGTLGARKRRYKKRPLVRAKRTYTRKKKARVSRMTNFGYTFPLKGFCKLPHVATLVLTTTAGTESSTTGIHWTFDRLEDVQFVTPLRQKPRGYKEFFGEALNAGPFNAYKVMGVSVNMKIFRNGEGDTPVRVMVKPFCLSPASGITNGVADTTQDGADWEEWGNGTWSTIMGANRAGGQVKYFKRYYDLKKLFGRGFNDSNMTRFANPVSGTGTSLIASAGDFDRANYQSSGASKAYSGLQVIIKALDNTSTITLLMRMKLVFHVQVFRGGDIITDTADI